ncbi:hypothetical protein D3C78_1693950 [compost metagenome]
MPGTRRSISPALVAVWLCGVSASITVTIIGASKLLRALPVAATVMVSSLTLSFLTGVVAEEEEGVSLACAKVTVGRVQAIARLNADKRSRVE